MTSPVTALQLRTFSGNNREFRFPDSTYKWYTVVDGNGNIIDFSGPMIFGYVNGDNNIIDGFGGSVQLTTFGQNNNEWLSGQDVVFNKIGDFGTSGISASGSVQAVIIGNDDTLWMNGSSAQFYAAGNGGYYQLAVAANLNGTVNGNNSTLIASGGNVAVSVNGSFDNIGAFASGEVYGHAAGNYNTEIVVGGTTVNWASYGDRTYTFAGGNAVELFGIGNNKTMTAIGNNVNATLIGDASQFTAIGDTLNATVEGSGDVIDMSGRNVTLTTGGKGNEALVHAKSFSMTQLTGSDNYVNADGGSNPSSSIAVLDLVKGTGNIMIGNAATNVLVDEGTQGGNYLQGGGVTSYVYGGGSQDGAGDTLVSTAMYGMLRGAGGNDVLIAAGEKGSTTTMNGADGNNVMVGRNGATDFFLFDASRIFGQGGTDTVANFNPGDGDDIGAVMPNGSIVSLGLIAQAAAQFAPPGQGGQFHLSIGNEEVQGYLANPHS